MQMLSCWQLGMCNMLTTQQVLTPLAIKFWLAITVGNLVHAMTVGHTVKDYITDRMQC